MTIEVATVTPAEVPEPEKRCPPKVEAKLPRCYTASGRGYDRIVEPAPLSLSSIAAHTVVPAFAFMLGVTALVAFVLATGTAPDGRRVVRTVSSRFYRRGLLDGPGRFRGVKPRLARRRAPRPSSHPG